MVIQLRPWKYDDANELASLANNEKVSAYMRDAFPYPYSLEAAQSFLELCKAANPVQELYYAVTVNGILAGGAGLILGRDVACRSAEVGYWLGEKFWGRGIATQAIRQLCEIGFQKFDIVRLEATVFANNIASQHVLEKCGFVREGILRKSVWKRGVLQDSIMYARVL